MKDHTEARLSVLVNSDGSAAVYDDLGRLLIYTEEATLSWSAGDGGARPRLTVRVVPQVLTEAPIEPKIGEIVAAGLQLVADLDDVGRFDDAGACEAADRASDRIRAAVSASPATIAPLGMEPEPQDEASARRILDDLLQALEPPGWKSFGPDTVRWLVAVAIRAPEAAAQEERSRRLLRELEERDGHEQP